MPRSPRTRPTTDKVRDAIFNVLNDAVDGAAVLDLFAGSGAMAIEALSRGAAWAELVESDREAAVIIRKNLDLTRMADRAAVWGMPVERTLAKLGRQFDLVIADPPYEMPGIHDLMERLGSQEILDHRGIVVLEHSKRFAALPSYGRLVRWQEKRYGDTAVSFYQVGSAE